MCGWRSGARGLAGLALVSLPWVGALGQPAAHLLEEATDAEYSVSLNLLAPDGWPAGGEVRLLFDQTPTGEGYALLFTADRCGFAKTNGAKMIPIGRAGSFTPGKPYSPCVVKRRLSRMTALVGGQVVATASDGAHHGGAVSWTSTHEALTVDAAYVQPVAPVEYSDDFARESGSSGGWESLTGAWDAAGPEGASPRPDLSANPFSYRARIGGRADFALAADGEWFWDDYRVQTAAKAGSAGALGVAAYVQDARNFLLFRWTSADELVEGRIAGRKQLIRVRDGEWTVLAESPGGFRADRWYQLALSAGDGWLRAEVDGVVAASAWDGSFGQGRIGLFAQDAAAAHFDDVVANATRDLVDEFEDDDLGWWQASGGEWACARGHLYCGARGAQPAELLIGDPDWAGYEIAADVKSKDAGAVSLFAYRGGDGQRYALRWERSGRLALLLMRQFAHTVLAESTLARDPTRFYRLALSVADGRIAASADGNRILEAANLELARGPAGLAVENAQEACFDNVAVAFARQVRPEFRVTAQFTREETMGNWVDPSRQWRQAEDQTLWYDLPLFGDFTLWLPQTDFAASKGALSLYLSGEPKRESAPLQVALKSEGDALSAQALVAGKAGPQGQVPSEGAGRVSLVRRGACLSVRCGETPLLALREEAVRGRYLGLRAEGLPLAPAETVIASPNLVDVTFSGAPTDWSPGLGLWEVTDRWPCAPGWSWFGGSGHQSPLLWSKDTFTGDQVLEFWAGLQMDMDQEPGYSHPSDLNGTICGDGEKLCSGYSFILAGAANTKSMILRGDQTVAENPQVKFENPVSMNFAFHRHWFDIRIEKTGNRLTYSVDGQPVAEWTDPDPLPGGKVAVWSWNNGLLIARARVAAERVTR